MASTAEVKILINGQETASRTMQSVAQSAQNLGARFSGIVRTAGIAATAIGSVATIAGVKLVKSAISGAASVEQTAVSFRVMLGDAEKAKQVLQSLTQFAQTTPFELPEIQNAAKSLLAFGISAQDLEPSLRSLGDIAAGLNIPIGELSELYGKARVQGRLFAEDVNQLTGRGIPVIQEFAKQFGVTEDKVKSLVESGQIGFSNLQEAVKNMTAEGGQFYDLMNQQSKTFGGTISNLKDSFGLLSRAIVGIDPQGNIQPGGLFDQFKTLAFGLLQVLNDNKQTIIAIAQGALLGLMDMIKKVYAFITTSLIPGFQSLIKNIIDTIQKVENTTGIFSLLRSQFINIVKFIQGELIPTIIRNKEEFAFLAKVVGAILIVALEGLVITLRTSLELLNSVLSKTAGISDFFSGLKNGSFGARDGLNSVKDSLNALLNPLDTVINKIASLSGLSSRAQSAISTITSIDIPGIPGINTGGVVTNNGILRFADGGIVPGIGNTDSVHALLTPGEMVINPKRGQSIMGKIEVNFINPVVEKRSDLDELIRVVESTLDRKLQLRNLGV